MAFRLRDIDPSGQFLPQLQLALLAEVFPRDQVQAVLRATGALTPDQRQRKLNLEVTCWLLVAMNLFAHAPLEHVLAKLCHGLCLLWPEAATQRELLPGKSAISYR